MEGKTFSALVLGSFMPPYDGAAWDITCKVTGMSAFLYLDDHLVCQGGNDPVRIQCQRVLPAATSALSSVRARAVCVCLASGPNFFLAVAT